MARSFDDVRTAFGEPDGKVDAPTAMWEYVLPDESKIVVAATKKGSLSFVGRRRAGRTLKQMEIYRAR